MKYLHHLLLAASAANAHSLFQQLWVGAADKGTSCARVPRSNSPVTNVNSADMRCNSGPAKASATCPIDAGESLTVEMHPQPNGERKCGKDSAIGGNHYGPVIIYMSKVSNAATADGSSDWFKVAEDGLDTTITTTDAWGTEKMNKNCGKKSFIIPKSTPSGEYLVRAEVIALHSQPAQLYMTCYQIKVNNGGNGTPGPLVKFPGAYKSSDPGISINIHKQAPGYSYDHPGSYVVPGPKVWSG
jgi:cellulase